MTKLSSALPEGESNGLSAIARQLIDRPQQPNVIVAIVDCKSTTTDNDTGSITPTARIRRVEAITIPGDRDTVAQLLRRALEQRTGQTVLPIDIEDDLKELFGNVTVNPETGEINE